MNIPSLESGIADGAGSVHDGIDIVEFGQHSREMSFFDNLNWGLFWFV